VAALWLAYHGRDELLERYAGSFTLTEVFRYVLRVSSDPFPTWVGDGYGAGIVNARRALTTNLPSEGDLRAASIAALATPLPATPTALIASVFSDVDETELRRWLAQKLDVAPSEVDARVAGFEEEVLFLVATDPDLRAELAPPDQSSGVLGVAPSSTPAPQPALPPERFSQPLRRRLHSAEVTP
jgi:thermitase